MFWSLHNEEEIDIPDNKVNIINIVFTNIDWYEFRNDESSHGHKWRR